MTAAYSVSPILTWLWLGAVVITYVNYARSSK